MIDDRGTRAGTDAGSRRCVTSCRRQNCPTPDASWQGVASGVELCGSWAPGDNQFRSYQSLLDAGTSVFRPRVRGSNFEIDEFTTQHDRNQQIRIQ